MPNKQRIAAATGILAPIIAFSCILLAIASYPEFSWTNNALSDLGVAAGATAQVFNLGLITCGLLSLIFVIIGLFAYFRKNLVGKIGAAILGAAAIALIGIGIFNENFSPTHYLFSAAFFVLMPISLLITSVALALNHQPKMALFTLLVAIIAAIPWILYFTIHYVPGVAIPETISGIAGALWIVGISLEMAAQTRTNPVAKQ